MIDIFTADSNEQEFVSEYDRSDLLVSLMLNSTDISDELEKYLDSFNFSGDYINIKRGLKIIDTLSLKDIERLSDTLKEMEPKLEPFPISCKCGFKTTSTIDIELKDILPTDGLEILNEFRNIS
jgi:hypothetical protein